MLGEKDAMPTIGVKDLVVAGDFYEKKLGLKRTATDESSVVGFRSGNTTLMVYESEYAGTNKATAVTWVVGDDVEKIVQNLKSKGVAFEHYDFPGMTHDGDVHRAGSMKVAWFKDPDGNILSIVNG